MSEGVLWPPSAPLSPFHKKLRKDYSESESKRWNVFEKEIVDHSQNGEAFGRFLRFWGWGYSFVPPKGSRAIKSTFG